MNNIINQIILCAVYFILLLFIQFQYHQAFDDMVSDIFLFDFISFDRSSHSQHHILRNIESEISFRVFRSSVSCPISSTLSFDLHCAQYTPFRSLFSDRLPKFVFTILWVTYDVILLFLLFSIAYILPFPSYCHWHSAHLFRSNLFRTVSTQCLRQVSAFLQAIMFMYAFDVITSSDIVE